MNSNGRIIRKPSNPFRLYPIERFVLVKALMICISTNSYSNSTFGKAIHYSFTEIVKWNKTEMIRVKLESSFFDLDESFEIGLFFQQERLIDAT